MKITWKAAKKEMIFVILIILFGALPMAYLFDRHGFTDWNAALKITLFYSAMWIFLWRGNEILYNFTDKHISWIHQPVKRFIVGMVSMILYTIFIFFIISYIFFVMIIEIPHDRFLNRSLIWSLSIAVGVTFLITLIMSSRSFLISWRQSAINEEKLRREQIMNQYETLKNQVNPHFLFNSLNTLSSLVHEDPDLAVQFINQLSDVYRYVLDTKDMEVSDLAEELQFAEAYLFLLKIRFGKNLIVENTIKDTRDYKILPLAIQMLIENAIKHNVVSEEDPLKIKIEMSEHYLSVTNSVKLKRAVQSSSGIGLSNIRQRYGYLTDKTVEVEEKNDSYTVRLPLLKMT